MAGASGAVRGGGSALLEHVGGGFDGGAVVELAIAQFGAALPLLAVAGWLYWGRGETGWAAFVAVWGLFVVGGVDNIIRPMLITRGMSMPLTLVFLGVIGGLLAYGLIGVFLGPTLVAIAYTLLLAWLAEPEAG